MLSTLKHGGIMQKHKRVIGLILVAALLQACATSPSSKSSLGDSPDETPIVQLKEIESARATDPDLPKMANEELDRIPVEVNPMVEKWIGYFQGRGRPHM